MADDFDALNNLFDWDGDDGGGGDDGGNGGDDDAADDDGEGDDFDYNAPNNIFGGVDFLPMPNAQDRPAADPIQWKVFKAKWGEIPYKDAFDEWCRNPHKLNMQTLLFRWAGMKQEKLIMSFLNDPASLAKRAKIQSIRKREMGLPDPNDKEDQKIENSYHVQIAKDRIAYLQYMLDNNVVVSKETYFRIKEGGTVIKDELHPLSQTARSNADRDLQKWIETYMMLTKQPTKISENRHDHEHGFKGSVGDLFTEKLKAINHRTMNGLPFMDVLNANPAALPAAPGEAEVVEGEVIEEPPINYKRREKKDEDIDPYASS